MRLLNFNTGKSQVHVIDGAEVQTAYIKSPVPQPWVITESGAAGDEVTAHTDDLYAFDHGSYEYWARDLGADRASWPDGFFAENLTVDAIDPATLRVGDELAVGSAKLVVTGPRVPCWKTSWRLGQPKTFIKHFRVSGRSGVYLGVREPGIVSPDDEITVTATDPDSPSVVDIARLCDSGDQVALDDLERINRALACPDLSQTVRMVLTQKMANLDRMSEHDGAGWHGWRSFVVDHLVDATDEIYSFYLRPSDDGPLPGFHAGQHVAMKLATPDGELFVRTFSLSEYADAPTQYRVTVKQLEAGRAVPTLLDAASTGRPIQLRSPAGSFRLDSGGFRPVVVIAAGIGIAPMIAMIQAHVGRGEGAPPLWLLYGTSGRAQAAFHDELVTLFDKHEDLHLLQFHSRPCPNQADAFAHERITVDRILKVLRENYVRIPSGTVDAHWFEADIYICGPKQFNTEISTGLIAAGANADLVYIEEFGSAYDEHAVASRTENARVRFDLADVDADWVASERRTLLELGEDYGLPIPFDCRSGSCHTCEQVILDGEVDGAVTTDVDGTRRALLCSSYPRSSDVRIDT